MKKLGFSFGALGASCLFRALWALLLGMALVSRADEKVRCSMWGLDRPTRGNQTSAFDYHTECLADETVGWRMGRWRVRMTDPAEICHGWAKPR